MKHLSAFILLALSAPLLALQCGDEIAQSVVLEQDLFCSDTDFGLTVNAPGVTIDLNGHRIVGRSSGQGIAILTAYSETSVIGPGRLEGWLTGVNAIGADVLTVRNVELINMQRGIELFASSEARILDNRFVGMDWHAVGIRTAWEAIDGLNLEVHSNLVARNRIEQADVGIFLCGYSAFANSIRQNDILHPNQAGIQIAQGALSNLIDNNSIQGAGSTGIEILYGRRNIVSRNRISGMEVAIDLDAGQGGLCDEDPNDGPLQSLNNQIRNNQLSQFDTGIRLDSWQGWILETLLEGNRLSHGHTGLLFGAQSGYGIASGTSFISVQQPVIDLGQGNSWP
jgi:parallel beta-helix repeat protein